MTVVVQDGAWVGRSVPRKEDARLLSGRGRFLADLASSRTLHAVFVRSTEPHALISWIDLRAAAAAPGVVAAFSGEDFRESLGPIANPNLPDADPAFVSATSFEMVDAGLPCIAVDRVRYVGEPVAVIVALDRHSAEDAAELVVVEYSSLDVVLDAEQALAEGAPVVHPRLGSNQAARLTMKIGDPAAAMAAAAVVVAETYRFGRQSAMPLECRGVLARYDPRHDSVEVWTSTQIPHRVRDTICSATGWSRNRVRVVVPDVGGGFGVKANVYGEEVVVTVLAQRLDRDVVWVEDRMEHLVSAAQSRDQVHHTRLSVADDGAILAWEDEYVVNVGAGSLWTAGIITATALHLQGPYRIPNLLFQGRAAFTNKALVAQYRGAGRPEACFALERSLDHAARQLGLSPLEIRRRNLLTADDLPYDIPLPYRDGVPMRYDGADYRACFEACVDLLPQSEVERVRREHPELRVGYGVAAYCEATGRGPHESARLELLEDGRFRLATGAASAGQGHETTFAQVVADSLQVTPDQVLVVQGDTGAVPHGVGTFASRSAILAGSASRGAALQLIDRAREAAATMLSTTGDKVEFADGSFTVDGTDVSVSWAELAAEFSPAGALTDEALPRVTTYFSPTPATVTWTMGAHAAIVGVDPDTGFCSVLRYAVAHEGGQEINPDVVRGQILGGVAQGIGGALLEEVHYSEEGQPLSVTLAEYLLPSTCDVPPVSIVHLYVPSASNPLDIRGIGESGVIPVAAAVASAIDDALPGGARVTSIPIAPHALLSRAQGAVSST
jgi:carbon-monoxide dehydrogenase large subunit